jgi:hypothetical protein
MDETTGSAFSWPAALDNVLNFMPTTPTATLKVNHDNVLAAAKVIQTQIDSLSDVVNLNVQSLIIEPAAGDPVSVDVANAWNHRLLAADDSYAARITEYLDSLRKVMTQLHDSAKTYGFNDQDIAASFGTTVA